LIVLPEWMGTTVPSLRRRVNQQQAASSLPVLDESSTLERPNHFSRG
jgi:hypothetical protein